MTENEREEILKRGEENCDKAIDLASNDEHDKALSYFATAEECFESVQDQHWLTFTGHKKLHSLQKVGKHEEALQLASRIGQGYRETDNIHGLALLLIHQADLLLEQNETFLAMECLRAAETIVVEEEFADLLGYVYSNISINLMVQEDYFAAIGYLKKTLENYTVDEHPTERSWCLQQLGICHQNIYDLKEAEKFLVGAYQEYLAQRDSQSAFPIMKRLKETYQNSNQNQKAQQLEILMAQIG
ncbi:MAG: hypothetical protein GY866_19955 [Proteobacteria bacterium]|nr:hypothetical protein [Pseudomonadota bacterium]